MEPTNVHKKVSDMALLKLKLSLLVAVTGFCVVEIVPGRPASASTQAPSPYMPLFIAAPCPFIPAVDQAEGRTMRCGFVAVPENRTHPDGRWIQLAVAIYKGPEVSNRPPL